jgi:putative membrane protein
VKIILRWLASAIALLAVAYLIPNIEVATFGTALLAALVIGLVNALLGTVLRFLTMPLTCLTLGLFSLVLNAFLFWLASEIVPGFAVIGAWAALLGAIIYGLLAAAIAGLFGAKE